MRRLIPFSPCILVACIALLSACAESSETPPRVPESATASERAVETAAQALLNCDPAKAGWAVGRKADDGVHEKARLDAGARVVRVLRPGQPVTMDYSVERLNIEVDDEGVVTRVHCG